MHRNYKRIVEQIIFCLDLNYVLAEAEVYGYGVSLDCGIVESNAILWSNDRCDLSLNYDLSCGLLLNYIMKNENKIIKMVIDDETYYPLSREIIIYIPSDTNINDVKKIFQNIVDISYTES